MVKTKFVYKERNADFLEKRGQSGSDFDAWIKRGVPTFKPKPGKNKVRILPPTWGDRGYYGYDVWVNYSIGPDKGSYLSLNKMKNAKDPIYEEYVRAKAEGREEDAKNLAARKRVLVWVIDRKQEDAGPLLWAMPITIEKSLCMLAVDSDTREVLSVDNPDSGYDVSFTKEGDGQLTKYTGIAISRTASSLTDDDTKYGAWLDYIVGNPAPDQLNYYTYDHIKRAFTGQVQEDPVAVDEEATPVRSTGRTLTNEVKNVTVDEEATPEEEEDEPAPPPPASNTRTSLAARLAARGR